MRATTKTIAFCSASFAIITYLVSASLPERLQIYGSIQEGRQLPLTIRSLAEQDLQNTEANYIQYYLPNAADRECNCQLVKESVARHGGKLEVLDSKIGKYFGVPLLHNGFQYRFADSILITISQSGNVISIHKGVNQAHLLMGLGLNGFITRVFDGLAHMVNQGISVLL